MGFFITRIRERGSVVNRSVWVTLGRFDSRSEFGSTVNLYPTIIDTFTWFSRRGKERKGKEKKRKERRAESGEGEGEGEREREREREREKEKKRKKERKIGR